VAKFSELDEITVHGAGHFLIDLGKVMNRVGPDGVKLADTPGFKRWLAGLYRRADLPGSSGKIPPGLTKDLRGTVAEMRYAEDLVKPPDEIEIVQVVGKNPGKKLGPDFKILFKSETPAKTAWVELANTTKPHMRDDVLKKLDTITARIKNGDLDPADVDELRFVFSKDFSSQVADPKFQSELQKRIDALNDLPEAKNMKVKIQMFEGPSAEKADNLGDLMQGPLNPGDLKTVFP
jgi:hypothetical protein